MPRPERSGVAVVAGAAFSPGYSCVLARHAATSFTTVTEVHVARSGTGGPACARQHHAALTGQGLDWRDGEWQRRAAGSGRELCWFPDPIGAAGLLPRRAARTRCCSSRSSPASSGSPPASPPPAATASPPTSRCSASRTPRAWSAPPAWRCGALRDGATDALVLGALDRPAVAAGATAALALRWAVGRAPAGRGRWPGRVDDPVAFLAELVTVGIKAAVFEGSG